MLIIFMNVPCDEYSSLNNLGKKICKDKIGQNITYFTSYNSMNGMDWKFIYFTYPVSVKSAISPHCEYLVYFLGFGSRNDKHLTSGKSYAVIRKGISLSNIPFY